MKLLPMTDRIGLPMSLRKSRTALTGIVVKTWAVAVCLCSLMANSAAALEVRSELVSKAVPSDTGNANSTPGSLGSADGRYVLFTSASVNLIDGIVDSNDSTDVFLHDRLLEVTTLVSRAAGSPSTTANHESVAHAMSANGEFALFGSRASNLVTGVSDSNGTGDVFLVSRSTGDITLVSRSAGSAVVAANSDSFPVAISGNGQWILFSSHATNLVPGVTDSNENLDVFLYRVSTGAIELVSKSVAGMTTGNNFSAGIALSDDADLVLFMSRASNLASGVVDENNGDDVFVYQRSTGSTSLVSRSANSPSVPANNNSSPIGISSDGEWIVFNSDATNVVAGVIDSNNATDAFLYQRSSGSISLVSRAASSPITTANAQSRARSISSDGQWVAFSSVATNLVNGILDNNSTQDAFLFQTTTQAVSLVSRTGDSATTTANNFSTPTALSADGEWVLFSSAGTDLVAGVADANGINTDVFLYRRSTGGVSLVSRSAGSAAQTGSSYSEPVAISPDAGLILFRSRASDLVAGVVDSNGADDVFVYRRDVGTVGLVSRSNNSLTVSANGASSSQLISSNGDWVLLNSRARNLVIGVTDSNNAEDVFLFQRSTGVMTLVSRSATSANRTANGQSTATAISADGNWVLFTSAATNLVPGIIEGNGLADVFLYQRSTGTITLVSRSATSASTTADAQSGSVAISADGEWVLFSSQATNLVLDIADENAETDIFLFRRSTGSVTLVSRAAGSAATASRGSAGLGISADGNRVLFYSQATDLIAGLSDSFDTTDVFLYDRSTGTVSLISRAFDSPSTTANSPSLPFSMSADGEWILFASRATNLVNGISDGNSTWDAFLFRRSTAAVILLSSSASAPAATANAASFPNGISADGEWVVLRSAATDLVAGVTDLNGGDDAFVFRRSTGVRTLVSHAGGSMTTTANHYSAPSLISADGRWILYSSMATNVLASGMDTNGMLDAFLYDRNSGEVTLVSRSKNSGSTSANAASTPIGMSADAQWVLFNSRATDVVSGVLDGNAEEDVILARIGDGLFQHGFESF